MAPQGDVTRPFVEALLEGRQPMTPGRDALEVTRVIDAAYRSVQEQRAVVLS
jgi:predicted dehydrogenase